MKSSNITPKPYFAINNIGGMCESIRNKDKLLHQHNYYCLYWMSKGTAVHATSFVEYTVPESAILFVQSALLHKMILDDGCEGIAIFFDRAFIDSADKSSRRIFESSLFSVSDFKTIVAVKAENRPLVTQLLTLLQNESTTNDLHHNDIISNLLRTFILYVNRMFCSRESSYAEDDQHYKIIKFKQLIEQEYKTYKDVAFYADSMQMSPNCLNEISKKSTGITAGELIRNRIIDEACKLLYATDISGKEIAFKLGFNDPSYFSRFFKKCTNTTLSDYRKRSRIKVP